MLTPGTILKRRINPARDDGWSRIVVTGSAIAGAIGVRPVDQAAGGLDVSEAEVLQEYDIEQRAPVASGDIYNSNGRLALTPGLWTIEARRKAKERSFHSHNDPVLLEPDAYSKLRKVRVEKKITQDNPILAAEPQAPGQATAGAGWQADYDPANCFAPAAARPGQTFLDYHQ